MEREAVIVTFVEFEFFVGIIFSISLVALAPHRSRGFSCLEAEVYTGLTFRDVLVDIGAGTSGGRLGSCQLARAHV